MPVHNIITVHLRVLCYPSLTLRASSFFYSSASMRSSAFAGGHEDVLNIPFILLIIHVLQSESIKHFNAFLHYLQVKQLCSRSLLLLFFFLALSYKSS